MILTAAVPSLTATARPVRRQQQLVKVLGPVVGLT